jgi:hypothetical protein
MADVPELPKVVVTVPSPYFHAFDRDVASDFGKSLLQLFDDQPHFAFAVLGDLIEDCGETLPADVPAFDLVIQRDQNGCNRQKFPDKRHNFCKLVLEYTVITPGV